MDNDFVYLTDILLFIVSATVTVLFLFRWYHPIGKSWPRSRAAATKTVLALLPVVAAVGFSVTLYFLSAEWGYFEDGIWIDFGAAENFDERIFYVMSYVLWGFTWIYTGLIILAFMGISSDQDALHADNKAAFFAVTGVFLAIAALYTGAQYGDGGADGGGWWIVLYAAGLGMFLFFLCVFALKKTTGIFERVTSDRDTGSGIRLGAFLLAAGLLCARGASGDYHGFLETLIELLDGWMVLLMTALAIAVERLMLVLKVSGHPKSKLNIAVSVLVACLYIAAAVFGALFGPSLVRALNLGYYAA